MGATYAANAANGATPDDALTAMLEEWLANSTHWDDPWQKGYAQVWDKPVTDDAIEWMQGWLRQNPPDGVDPRDKWGPWLMFPLARGGWYFFGWVNT
jgi:hypothetical protein